MNRRKFQFLAMGGLCGLGAAERLLAQEEGNSSIAPPDRPLPYVDGSFTLVVLPDTQVYSQSFPQHFMNQTRWLVQNREARNIQFVMHLGDITNNNVAPQWKVAQEAIQQLDGAVPYSLVPGNHDYGPNGDATTRETGLNEYFSVDQMRRQTTFGDVFEPGRLDNSYHMFTTRGISMLVLALEFGPRQEVVEWANSIVDSHPQHMVLLTTHAYMYYDESRYDWKTKGAKQHWNPHSYGCDKLPGSTNDGQELWDKLVSKHKNFLMTLNGHVLGDGLGKLSTASVGGFDVHQMLVNYQMKKEGGEGYLRLIEFLPDNRTIQVKCYSPSLDQYKTDPQNQFVLQTNLPVST